MMPSNWGVRGNFWGEKPHKKQVSHRGANSEGEKTSIEKKKILVNLPFREEKKRLKGARGK